MMASLAGLLVFVAASVLAALAMVLPGHRGLDQTLALIALGTGLLAGAGAFFHVRRLRARLPARRRRRLSPWGWAVLVAFALFAFRTFCWLVYFEGDFDASKLAIGSPNNLGDLSMHLQEARYFADGAPWWPEHPEAAGQSLRYYPGINVFQSLLLLLGADDLRALTWVGLLGAAATALALYRWGGSFTVAGFLFSGGLAGFEVFRLVPLTDFQSALAWKSLPLAIFATQRPFLFALPAGLLLLLHWRQKFFTDPPLPPPPAADARPDDPPPPLPARDGGLLPFWVEALLYAAMPVFHLFAFVFLSGLLGWWFVAYIDRARVRWHLLKLVGVALVPATIQLALMTGNFAATHGVLHLEWAWMNHDADPAKNLPFVWFWLWNFGLFALLAPALWCLCAWDFGRATLRERPFAGRHREDDAAAAFVLPAGVFFLAACVVMFAKWDWDNTKLMIWCYLAMLPFLWRRWVRPLALPARIIVCVLLFFSGAVSLAGGLDSAHLGYELIKRAELDGARAGLRAVPPGGRFASAPEYNHPLVYCGRKLAMGFDGHLFSQGIDYGTLLGQLNRLMLGEAGWRDAARQLGVRYVYWGPREEKRWPESVRPWEQAGAPVAAGAWGKIFDLGKP